LNINKRQAAVELFSSGVPAESESKPTVLKGLAMSAIRKIAVPAATLFLGLSALFLTTGTATAAGPSYGIDCVEDWHTTCP
jgi:hypothetical protein